MSSAPKRKPAKPAEKRSEASTASIKRRLDALERILTGRTTRGAKR